MEEKKKNNKKTIFIIIGALLGIALIRFLFLILVFLIALSEEKIDYTVVNNIININDNDIVVEEKDYGLNDGCYTIQLKIDRNYEIKKKLFDDMFSTNTLQFEYSFYDKDGYNLGYEYAIISDFDKSKNWKLKVSYCNVDADEIVSYKVTDISVY